MTGPHPILIPPPHQGRRSSSSELETAHRQHEYYHYVFANQDKPGLGLGPTSYSPNQPNQTETQTETPKLANSKLKLSKCILKFVLTATTGTKDTVRLGQSYLFAPCLPALCLQCTSYRIGYGYRTVALSTSYLYHTRAWCQHPHPIPVWRAW